MVGYEAHWAQREYDDEMDAMRECPECKDVQDNKRVILSEVAKASKILIAQLYSKEEPVSYYALQTAMETLVDLLESYTEFNAIDLPDHFPLVSRMSAEAQEIWAHPISAEAISNLK